MSAKRKLVDPLIAIANLKPKAAPIDQGGGYEKALRSLARELGMAADTVLDLWFERANLLCWCAGAPRAEADAKAFDLVTQEIRERGKP